MGFASMNEDIEDRRDSDRHLSGERPRSKPQRVVSQEIPTRPRPVSLPPVQPYAPAYRPPLPLEEPTITSPSTGTSRPIVLKKPVSRGEKPKGNWRPLGETRPRVLALLNKPPQRVPGPNPKVVYLRCPACQAVIRESEWEHHVQEHRHQVFVQTSAARSFKSSRSAAPTPLPGGKKKKKPRLVLCPECRVPYREDRLTKHRKRHQKDSVGGQ